MNRIWNSEMLELMNPKKSEKMRSGFFNVILIWPMVDRNKQQYKKNDRIVFSCDSCVFI